MNNQLGVLMSGKNELLKIGFKYIGNWELNNENKLKLIIKANDELLNTRGLYAYLLEDKDAIIKNTVKYIGIPESPLKPVKERLHRYETEKRDGKTSKRVADNIRNTLLKGQNVSVYVLIPNDITTYNDINIDLVRGLEYPLINLFCCEWNRRGKY